jgi:TonB family protein
VVSLALALLLAAAPADFAQYLEQIRGRVQSVWKYPAKSESLQATVKFNLDRPGRITELEITKPSGRKDFDASVLEAVRSATPFPPLLSILKKSEVREVRMTFKGKSVLIEPKPAAPKKSGAK